MKRINQRINHKSAIAIIISYVFYVLGRSISRSQMNEVSHSDLKLKALTEIMLKHKEKVTSNTSKELWDTVIQFINEASLDDQESTVDVYCALSDDELTSIIKAEEFHLSLSTYSTLKFSELLQEIPRIDLKHTLLIGYQIPYVSSFLSESNGTLDIAVFDLIEFIVASIQVEVLELKNARIHMIENEKQYKNILDMPFHTVFINELARETKDFPLFDVFYKFNIFEFKGERLPLQWLMIYSLINDYRINRVISFVDERDLRHRRLSHTREKFVNENLVESVISIQGGRASNYSLIVCQHDCEDVLMKAIEYGTTPLEVKELFVNVSQIKKSKFSILSPFDYTSRIELDNAVDLASVAMIFSGYQVGLSKIKEMNTQDVQVEVRMVSMPHLNKFEVLTPSDEYIIKVGRNVHARFEILENDILIASKSNDPKPTLVRNKPMDQFWIANSSLIVIRLNSQAKLTAEYVFAYLSSEKGMSQLKRLQRGSIVFITTHQISDILIEKTNREEIDRITRAVSRLVSQQQAISKELKQIESEFERLIY